MAKVKHLRFWLLALWLATTLQGCGPDNKVDYLKTEEVACGFAIGLTIIACCACCVGLAAGPEGRIDGVNPLPFCALGALCLSVFPWISYGLYKGNQTCETLRSMDSGLCAAWLDGAEGFSEAECCFDPTTTSTTAPKPGCQILFEQDSFFCAEWKLPHPDNTSQEACCTPLPPCRCKARSDSAEVQCEPFTVLLGPTCVDGDWSTCFSQKRLCTTTTGCQPLVNDSAFSCDYPTAEQCNLQSVSCIWVQKDIYLDSGCHGLEPRFQSPCASLPHARCLEEQACEWKMSQQVESCLNGGVFLGCSPMSGFSAVAQECAKNPSKETCALESVCEWRDECECPLGFVGRLCQEERAKFQADEELCSKRPDADMAAVCRGIVIASAEDSDHEPHSQLCSKEVHDCQTWEEVKATVARMWEVEFGDCIVDGLAVLMVSVCLLCRATYHTEQGGAKFLLLATLVSFSLDFALEFSLLNAVRDVAGDEGPIAKIQDSLCFTQGGNSGQEALTTLAGNIEDLALINIILAVFGAVCDLLSGLNDCRKADAHRAYGLVPAFLASASALGELLLGLYNFWFQTREFVEKVETIEKVVLGLETFEKGGACFKRSLLLDPTTPAGVPWAQPFLYVVAPGVTCTVVFVLAGCCVCCCGCRSGGMSDRASPPADHE